MDDTFNLLFLLFYISFMIITLPEIIQPAIFAHIYLSSYTYEINIATLNKWGTMEISNHK